MPPKNGLRLNHLGKAEQIRPDPRHPYEQGAISTAKSKTRWSLPQSNGELMAEKQILSFKPGPRLE
jgi:predicted methyltransferase